MTNPLDISGLIERLAVQCEEHAVYGVNEALACSYTDFASIDRVIKDLERAERLRALNKARATLEMKP